MLLLLNVLFDEPEWSASGGRTKIGTGPQRRQFPLEPWKLLEQEARGTAFDQLHQAMDAKLGIDTDEEMHLARHHFQFLNLCLILLANLTNKLL